jgi:hypothetical protein
MPEPTPRPDVPDELVQMMADAEYDAPPGCSAWDSYRTVLAAVIPEIERRTREQVAAEANSLAVQFAAMRSASTEAEAATLRWFAAWLVADRRDAPTPPAARSEEGR